MFFGFLEHLFEVPDMVPIIIPEPPRSEDPFLVRFGNALIYEAGIVEHAISPSGRFRIFLKLIMKWFITFTILVCAIGGVALIASVFFDSISGLIKNAFESLFHATIYFVGIVLLLASLMAVIMLVIRKYTGR